MDDYIGVEDAIVLSISVCSSVLAVNVTIWATVALSVDGLFLHFSLLFAFLASHGFCYYGDHLALVLLVEWDLFFMWLVYY